MAAASTLRSGTEAETRAAGLPTDAIYEILTRLPARDLCRLRAVCRPWRSLLSDPQFVAAHAARHPGPLIVVTGREKTDGDGDLISSIVDLSGQVIKQIRSREGDRLMSTHRNLACIETYFQKRCQLLNLVTGERFSLPEELSQEHRPRKLDFANYRADVALGQVASTGELKLLRVVEIAYFNGIYEQLCEVFTVGGRSGDARWRGKKAAQDHVHLGPTSRVVVVDGVVYFLLDENVSNQDDRPKGIASFDLLTEEWRPILRGPLPILARNIYDNLSLLALDGYDNLSLAALDGSLVLVHCTPSSFSMDLWFLMDIEKGLWVKQHTVKISLGVTFAHPLVILNNGMIAYIISGGLLKIYNPRTNTCTDAAELGRYLGIDLYTGNLLSLANDAI